MWKDILKALERIALSDKDKIKIEKVPQEVSFKPNGLWYSFSLGSGWMRGNMLDYGWLESYQYMLYLDTSELNILQIKNLEDANAFYSRWNRGKRRNQWDSVAFYYDGVELLNYNNWVEKYGSDNPVMEEFGGWDMDSGCIWNTQNLKVKKVKPIEERHYKRQHKEQLSLYDYIEE